MSVDNQPGRTGKQVPDQVKRGLMSPRSRARLLIGIAGGWCIWAWAYAAAVLAIAEATAHWLHQDDAALVLGVALAVGGAAVATASRRLGRTGVRQKHPA